MRKIDLLLETTKAIHDLLKGLCQHLQERHALPPHRTDEVLWGMQEVCDYLHISRSTYYRMVRSGALVPRRQAGRDYFYPADLSLALEESRRRGRI